ncbi:putative carbohydrate sulfotransferase 11 [Penaeus vannamei]|uniref:Carbohydrate sulfotransferase n=1 Tax=Penaeus vannamei TaxID=6689 RepID=A0A423TDV3_PENVA|nr:putative carbohydrate sulfotransferase 11 [Penaeus vannamei]
MTFISISRSPKKLLRNFLLAFLIIFAVRLKLSKQKEAAAGRAAEVTDEPRVEVLGNRAALRVKPKTEQWALEMEEVPLESVDLEEVGLRLEERRSEIRRRCERFLTSEELQEAPNSREFLINKDYGLVWCNVFKAASSTWLYNFLLLAGISKKVIERSRTSPVEVARTKAYPRPSVEELRAFVASANATSFLIVREPFQRLLSAFRDKIEANHQAHYRSLRCHIQTKVGRRSRRGVDCQPTFPEFVDYLLEERAKGHAPNEHWAPYYSFCSPCQVAFDYVLRFESLSQEEAFLVAKFHSGGGSGLSVCGRGVDYETATRHYFSQLSEARLLALYAIYKRDFEIFGYDATPYFDYAKDS